MPTGAFFAGTCYPSTDAASDAYFAQVAPVHVAGATGYVSQFAKVGGVWELLQYSVSGGVSTLVSETPAPVPSFAACDPMEKFNDGVVIGWGIALTMIAAWCIKSMHGGM